MLNDLLKKHFNLSEFRIGQEEIIQAVVKKHDALAVLPTGGGKSLCYQLPAVYFNQLVIVISPLIALMKDQVASLKRFGIPSACLYSGQSDVDKRQIFSTIENSNAFVLYLSPERVQKEGFQNWIKDRKIAAFAIDEAHCVSQWGHDFREDYSSLKILKAIRPDVPVLALTASATPLVLKDIIKILDLKKPQVSVHGFYRPNLYYQVELCSDESHKLRWIQNSLKQVKTGRVIIYCGTRKITEELAAQLQEEHQKVGYYHAGMTTDERTRIQNDYQKGNIRILVATNAFGMGIDQPDVRLVIHFQMPANIDSLYQEMGRAGRDNEPSTCLLLYAKKDKGLQTFFIQNSKATGTIKNHRWNNLEALVNYCEAEECRHAEILTYFKDAQRISRCGHCDVCDPHSSRMIATPDEPQATILRKSKGASKKDSSPLTAAEEECFKALRQWRKAKAQELDLPAFVIFSDQTLRDLARKQPRTITELQNIHGIGPQKLERFGEELIAELFLF